MLGSLGGYLQVMRGPRDGCPMFRFWAGATASFFVCSLGVSGVSAEGIGSTVTPFTGSQPAAAIVFADVNFSSGNGPVSLLDRASDIGLATAGDSAASSQSYAFIDFASASPFGAGWSPMNSVVNATLPGTPKLTDSGTAVDMYFGVFESLFKQEVNGQRSGASFVQPMGGSSALRTMR